MTEAAYFEQFAADTDDVLLCSKCHEIIGAYPFMRITDDKKVYIYHPRCQPHVEIVNNPTPFDEDAAIAYAKATIERLERTGL